MAQNFQSQFWRGVNLIENFLVGVGLFAVILGLYWFFFVKGTKWDPGPAVCGNLYADSITPAKYTIGSQAEVRPSPVVPPAVVVTPTAPVQTFPVQPAPAKSKKYESFAECVNDYAGRGELPLNRCEEFR